MKRGGPLKRRTPLRADPAKTRAWRDRSRTNLARRTPLRATGAKAERERPALDAFRAELRRRSSGRCEVVTPGCPTTGPHAGAHAHHVWPEDRDAGHHDPARGLFLCADAHAWTHEHPAAAARLGTLRPDTEVTCRP